MYNPYGLYPHIPILIPLTRTMSARGTRTLSRLFHATMRMKPDKKASRTVEGAIPVPWEKGGMLESDIASEEQEKIWQYYTKLVFKDGEFLVCIDFAS